MADDFGYRMDCVFDGCMVCNALASENDQRSHLQLPATLPSHVGYYALAESLCRAGSPQQNNVLYCLRR